MIDAAGLLGLWERGVDRSPIERALLFAGAVPGAPADPAELPVGTRDALLLRLRAAVFGDRIDARATCFSCGEELEFTLSTGSLLAATRTVGEPVISGDGWRARFRVPTTADVVAVADRGTAALLALCVVEVEGEPADGALLEAAGAAIGAADPLADLTLALRCPSCAETTDAPFDIVSLFWTELDVWARRMMAEVDVIARAYGWSEREILALGPERRAVYLEMAASR